MNLVVLNRPWKVSQRESPFVAKADRSGGQTRIETKPIELLATERRSTCSESRLERF